MINLILLNIFRSILSFVPSYETCNEEKRRLVQAKLPAFTEGILAVIPGCKCTEHGVILESLSAIVKVSGRLLIITLNT